MKKAIISQPMNGKTTEQIREERAAAVEFLTAQGFEVIDTVFELEESPKNAPLLYMAKSIEAMANCDIVYFLDGWQTARGCQVEYHIARQYGVETILYTGVE